MFKSKEEFLEEEIQEVLGTNEEVIYSFFFAINRMIITNKKLIFIDAKIAKSKNYIMIPFNKITSYSLLKPSGLSIKTKLKIFTGGDNPSLELESIFDDGMKEFCKVLADKI